MSPITIRTARHADSDAIARIAALDSARAPHGDVLVAEVGGEVVAAHSGSGTVADPFRPTADIVELLRVRAAADVAPMRPARRLAFHRLRLA
jgi:hypothetical protein